MAFKIISFITILPIFQAGYIIKDEVQIGTAVYKQENILYLNVGVKFLVMDSFYVYGDIENYFEPCEDRVRFSPILDVYNIGAGLEINQNTHLKIITSCTHPVNSSNDPNENFKNVPRYYGSKTMILFSINK